MNSLELTPEYQEKETCSECRQDFPADDMTRYDADKYVCPICIDLTEFSYFCPDCDADFVTLGVPKSCPKCDSFAIYHSEASMTHRIHQQGV